jgi:hypothetical protein
MFLPLYVTLRAGAIQWRSSFRLNSRIEYRRHVGVEAEIVDALSGKRLPTHASLAERLHVPCVGFYAHTKRAFSVLVAGPKLGDDANDLCGETRVDRQSAERFLADPDARSRLERAASANAPE